MIKMGEEDDQVLNVIYELLNMIYISMKLEKLSFIGILNLYEHRKKDTMFSVFGELDQQEIELCQ